MSDSSRLMSADEVVLGFDIGSRRIGVALGSGYGTRAIAVVEVRDRQPDWAVLDRLVREWKPKRLIVGDPLTLEGEDQPARRWAHEVAHWLIARYQLPVLMMDERSSSIEAAQRFAGERAAGRKRRRDAAALDAMAAAIIVERWLLSPDDARPL